MKRRMRWLFDYLANLLKFWNIPIIFQNMLFSPLMLEHCFPGCNLSFFFCFFLSAFLTCYIFTHVVSSLFFVVFFSMKILCMICCMTSMFFSTNFAYYSYTQTVISLSFALSIRASCYHKISFNFWRIERMFVYHLFSNLVK